LKVFLNLVDIGLNMLIVVVHFGYFEVGDGGLVAHMEAGHPSPVD
jgi:hypothetical protein